MVDLHIHTRFSHDSAEDAENYVLAARVRGDKYIGFSEHYDYDAFLVYGAGKYPLPDLNKYFETVASLSDKYADIGILKGVELGYLEKAVPHYKRLLNGNAFDYSILSVHMTGDRGDCYYPDFFKGLTKKQAYGEYFKAVLESVRSDIDYDIVGHLGYVARYAPYSEKRVIYAELSDVSDEILKEIISRGASLEINTSARGTGEPTIPCAGILERYLELGGRNFTFGSDAHSVQRYKENAEAVRDFLLSRGVNEICRYKSHRIIREKL